MLLAKSLWHLGLSYCIHKMTPGVPTNCDALTPGVPTNCDVLRLPSNIQGRAFCDQEGYTAGRSFPNMSVIVKSMGWGLRVTGFNS